MSQRRSGADTYAPEWTTDDDRSDNAASSSTQGSQRGVSSAKSRIFGYLRNQPADTHDASIGAWSGNSGALRGSERGRLRRVSRYRFTAILLSVVAGLGILTVAHTASRNGDSSLPTHLLFWVGLVLIFVPTASRALAKDTPRAERITQVVILGMALYLAKIIGSPFAFTFIDEFIHVRSTQDILQYGRLFGENSLLPSAAFYPGLPALTAGVVDLTGLSIFAGGLLVIGFARLMWCVFFFLIAERLTKSSRGAATASVIYAANPMFLSWSAAFSYENLALPLAAFALWWIGRTRHSQNPLSYSLSLVAVTAVTVTHHVVGFALAALLCAWWLAERVLGRSAPSVRRSLGSLAIFSGCITSLWFFVVAHPAPPYLLEGNLYPALNNTMAMLLSGAGSRTLYSSGGMGPPLWEPVAGLAATAILVGVLPFALARAWRERRRPAMVIAMLIAVAYPITLIPRLAPHGVALSGRSSEYVYTGLACVIGLLSTSAWRVTPPGRHGRQARMSGGSEAGNPRGKWMANVLGLSLLATVFVGNVTVGNPFYQRLSPPVPSAGYEWSVQSDVIAAAEWARDNLGDSQRFAANAVDALALATYGRQHVVNPQDSWPAFFADTMSDTAVQVIQQYNIRFVLVNWRMTQGVPLTPGYYFSPFEPGAGEYRDSFPVGSLDKFFTDSCIKSLHTVGAAQILDVSEIEKGTCR